MHDFLHTLIDEDRSPAAAIDQEKLLRCVHCGICTSSCPTYLETGDENNGPRGRIQLIRMVTTGQSELTDRMQKHLDLCLDCRACESICPSGVEYGRLIEPFRQAVEQADQGPEKMLEKQLDWFRRFILLGLFPSTDRLRRATRPVRALQRLGIYDAARKLGVFKLLPDKLRRLVEMMPPPAKPGPRLPKFLPAKGRMRARVVFFVGCVADAMFRPIHWATVRVLQENGCDVFVPRGQGCCGAIHLHNGDPLGARRLADANLIAFELDRCDAIVVNHGGCGAMLKEYGHHWHDGLQPHRERFAAKVKDVHELIDSLGLAPLDGPIDAVATYHDSCHLAHVQRVTAAPRKMLAKIPGLQLRELPEANICCGAAGTYNLTQPEMADRLARRKMENIVRTGARVLVTANAGCLLQIEREARLAGVPLKVVHPMELLDLSYRREKLLMY
jgi:glycolate oxidase iron-sulfur subunit